MENAPATSSIPPSIDRVLKLFRSMGREEKMQALVQYSKKLEPLPERFKDLDRGASTSPNAMTRVDIIPEVRDGRCISTPISTSRESPTIAAVLAIIFAAVNGQPPSTTLGIPPDFVSILMESIGLAAREPGLNAMIMRLKRYAREAEAQTTKAS